VQVDLIKCIKCNQMRQKSHECLVPILYQLEIIARAKVMSFLIQAQTKRVGRGDGKWEREREEKIEDKGRVQRIITTKTYHLNRRPAPKDAELNQEAVRVPRPTMSPLALSACEQWDSRGK
jgi:hypothetical protein